MTSTTQPLTYSGCATYRGIELGWVPVGKPRNQVDTDRLLCLLNKVRPDFTNKLRTLPVHQPTTADHSRTLFYVCRMSGDGKWIGLRSTTDEEYADTLCDHYSDEFPNSYVDVLTYDEYVKETA